MAAAELRGRLGRPLEPLVASAARAHRRRGLRRRELAHLRARRRRRLLAAAAYSAALFTAGGLVLSGLGGGSAASRTASSGVAGAVASSDDPDVLAAQVVEAAAERSLATIGSAGRHAAGFVAWKRGGDTYVLTARAAVAGLLRNGKPWVVVAAGGQRRGGRVVAVRARAGLAVVRVHGDMGEPLLAGGRLGRLTVGGPAVVAAPRSHGARPRLALVGRRPDGTLAVAGKGLPLGAPVLDGAGAVAGLLARGGSDARIASLRGCSTLDRCFPTLAGTT